MIKTSTPKNSVNYLSQQPTEKVVELAKKQDEMFYDSIKVQLDQLIKDPSDETINKILAYSKKK